MLPQIVSQSTEYAQEIAVLVAQMPVEQAMQVYDFVLDLQMRGANIPSNSGNGKRLNGSATPMELDHEEKSWERAYMANRDHFRAMAQQALSDLDAGETLELVIENGKISAK